MQVISTEFWQLLIFRYTFVHNTYDGYMLGAGASKPDLVAAFNCGFIFYQSWDSSIPPMIKYPDVPLVFTEYYQVTILSG